MRKNSAFQIHLLTAVIVMVLAGILLGLNLTPRHIEYSRAVLSDIKGGKSPEVLFSYNFTTRDATGWPFTATIDTTGKSRFVIYLPELSEEEHTKVLAAPYRSWHSIEDVLSELSLLVNHQIRVAPDYNVVLVDDAAAHKNLQGTMVANISISVLILCAVAYITELHLRDKRNAGVVRARILPLSPKVPVACS